MGGDGWRYMLGRCGWVEIFYEWVGVGGHFFWMGGDGSEWVEVYFFRYFLRAGGSELVAVGGDIFWVGRGRWA